MFSLPNRICFAKQVKQILFQNKDRLVIFLEDFINDRQDDRQFVQDKKTVIEKIANLTLPEEKMADGSPDVKNPAPGTGYAGN